MYVCLPLFLDVFISLVRAFFLYVFIPSVFLSLFISSFLDVSHSSGISFFLYVLFVRSFFRYLGICYFVISLFRYLSMYLFRVCVMCVCLSFSFSMY